ncbi:MAG: RNA methyltransferase [Nitrospira bacterium HGW-Nitrospira-1]|nr:MAG: RNA methyltransferase [Nitrospira bacterium HGW-Nitrospira-1]
MDSWKQNIYFVLVEPKEPGNIGASARAIKNMGFRNLCLVKPPAEMSEEGRWFARNAHDVLDSAETHDSVEEALRDKAVVVGTTRRIGKMRGVILPVEKGAARVRGIAENNKVAILFGREARGLNNDEVNECGFMIKIPSSEIQPSLNLSQAVLIIAYELSKFKEAMEDACCNIQKKKYNNSALMEDLKAHGEIAPLYERISGVLELLEYIPRGDRNLIKNIIVNLKHFIGRAGLTEKELNMIQGICTQIEKKVVKR